jgi:hypothetical protein
MTRDRQRDGSTTGSWPDRLPTGFEAPGSRSTFDVVTWLSDSITSLCWTLLDGDTEAAAAVIDAIRSVTEARTRTAGSSLEGGVDPRTLTELKHAVERAWDEDHHSAIPQLRSLCRAPKTPIACRWVGWLWTSHCLAARGDFEGCVTSARDAVLCGAEVSNGAHIVALCRLAGAQRRMGALERAEALLRSRPSRAKQQREVSCRRSNGPFVPATIGRSSPS